VSTTNPPEHTADTETMPDIEIDPRDLRHLADAQMNVELDTGDMILNLGPQHPATHGTLRVVVRLDGERVISADPVIGYMHRGYEKLTEFRTYPQITTLINRIDWLSSFANEVPFIDGAERLMGVTAPPRAQYIRTMLTELSRIATFVLFLGEMSLQVGGITPAFFGFRDREHILNLIESATGGRFHPNFNRIGGIKDDLPWGWLSETRSAMQMVLNSCDDFEDLVAGNEIFQARTRSIGIIPGELGATYGVSGSNLRASGVDWDLRRDGAPYLVYPELDFKVWTHPDGDSYARYMVRLQETRESARMVVQMLDQIPEGPVMAKVPRIIKVPEGEVWVETENPLGQMGYYIVSKGGTGPFRVKIRSASFSNVSILPWLLRGVYVPDVITILASLYFILGDIDR
jgi:NADH-quinone oxidoreductase subunit D